MQLTPREKDKLLVAMAANVARQSAPDGFAIQILVPAAMV